MTGERSETTHSGLSKTTKVISYRVAVYHLIRAVMELHDHATLTEQTRDALAMALKGLKRG